MFFKNNQTTIIESLLFFNKKNKQTKHDESLFFANKPTKQKRESLLLFNKRKTKEAKKNVNLCLPVVCKQNNNTKLCFYLKTTQTNKNNKKCRSLKKRSLCLNEHI